MRKAWATAALLTLLAGAEPATSGMRLSDFLSVFGRVTASTRPADNALVIAFNLGDFQAWQTVSGVDGTFRLPPLPAGVYRIIAVKQGFAPAVATIAPNRPDHAVALKLRPGAKIAKEDRDQIWEIRRSLPPDILRQLDLMLATPEREAAFHGQMASLASVAPERASPSFAETAVGVRGAFGGGWAVDVKGNYHVLSPTASDQVAGDRLAEASDVSMEITSADDSYRLMSTRKSWQGSDEIGMESAGDFEALRIEWNRANTRVALRYFAEENLFVERADSELVELTGETRLQQGPRSDLAILVRVGQGSSMSHAIASEPQRVADLAATGRYEIADALRVHYGLQTRFAEDGYEWAPATAAEVRIARRVSLLVSALYKMLDASNEGVDRLPTVIVLNQTAGLTPRYRYSMGVVAGDAKKLGSVSATATVSEIDSVVRLVFDERFEPWWEGLDLEPGDVHHDLAVALRKHVGKRFAFDLSTSAGRARGDATDTTYLVGTLQSLYRPTGTSIDVSYRRIDGGDLIEIEKLNLRMGQSLRLPLDLRLLLGVDLARSTQPLYVEAGDEDGLQRRLVGGVGLAF